MRFDRRLAANLTLSLTGLTAVALGVSSTELVMKLTLSILGVVAVLAGALGLAGGLLGGVSSSIRNPMDADGKRKRRFCPKCLSRVKTVIDPDRGGFRYWCPNCREVVPIPTTLKRVEKFRRREEPQSSF